jgi:hypothetical protein
VGTDPLPASCLRMFLASTTVTMQSRTTPAYETLSVDCLRIYVAARPSTGALRWLNKLAAHSVIDRKDGTISYSATNTAQNSTEEPTKQFEADSFARENTRSARLSGRANCSMLTDPTVSAASITERTASYTQKNDVTRRFILVAAQSLQIFKKALAGEKE